MKKAIIIILALVLLAFLGQYLWFYVFGKAEGLVFAPPRAPVLATVDGGEPVRVPAGRVGTVPLTQGAHKVKLQVGGASVEHVVTVQAAYERIVLPALDPQCFVTLDVTTSHYQRPSQAGQAPALPHVTQRHTEAGPFKLPATAHLSEADLPDRTQDQTGAYLFRPAACALLSLSDADLLGGLGYGKPDSTR